MEKRNECLLFMRRGLYLGVVFSFLVVALSSFVLGFGVASEYSADNPLEVYPGQSVDTFFSVQNVLDDAVDTRVEGSVIQGAEIARLLGSLDFDLDAGQEVIVNIRIEVSEDVTIGTEYTVEALFEQVPSGETGETVGFFSNVAKDFRVVVIAMPEGAEEESSGGGNFWVWVILIVVLVLIIWIIMKWAKKK
jgi:hypothetical protein